MNAEREAEIRAAVRDIGEPFWPGLTESDWAAWANDLLAGLDAEREGADRLAEALREKARDAATAAAGCDRDCEWDLADHYRGKSRAFREAADLAAFRAVSPGEAKP